MGASLPFSAFAWAANTDICPWRSASASADSFCSPPLAVPVFSAARAPPPYQLLWASSEFGLCLYGLGLLSLDRSGDSILAKECRRDSVRRLPKRRKASHFAFPLPPLISGRYSDSFRSRENGARPLCGYPLAGRASPTTKSLLGRGPASMLASMSVAMPEEIARSHSSPPSAELHSSAVCLSLAA